MTRITDERLAEMVGAGVPCVPAQPGEIAAVVQELRRLRSQASVSTASMSYLYALLGAETWIEAGAIWDQNPVEREGAYVEVRAALGEDGQ